MRYGAKQVFCAVSCSLMSLLQASDDALRLILAHLPGPDIYRLKATGSKRLFDRVERLTEHLLWIFERPTFFPSYCYEFANLKSLTVRVIAEYGHYVHVSLLGRSLFPLEPMARLETLDLDFSLSLELFTPPPHSTRPHLASCFPRLTSLSIKSSQTLLLPDHWEESLP